MERDSTQPDDSAQNVFDTPELYEHILSYLGTTDLIRTKRVCRRFDEVINNSPVLQESLFLRPRSNTFLCATVSNEPDQRLRIEPKPVLDPRAIDAHSEYIIYERHPIFPHTKIPARSTRLIEHITLQTLYTEGTAEKNDTLVDLTYSTLYRFPISHPEKTYICQPPAKDVEISLEGCRSENSINVHDDIGITFAMIHQAARNLVELDIEEMPRHMKKRDEMPEITIQIRRAIVLNGEAHRKLQSSTPLQSRFYAAGAAAKRLVATGRRACTVGILQAEKPSG
jgi:hypothetical protein